MRKAKSLKNITFKKYGEVDLGNGVILPIKTLSIAEEAKAVLSFPNEVPRKLEKPSEELKKRLTENDPKYNDKMYAMIRVYDVSDTKYLEMAEKIQRYSKTLEAIKYIDFDATIDEEGKVTLYQDMGVEVGDWFGICAKFDEMGFGAVEFEKVINKAKALQGETLFEKLGKIQTITDMDMFTLITKLELVTSGNTNMDDHIETLLKTIDESKIMDDLENIAKEEESENLEKVSHEETV